MKNRPAPTDSSLARHFAWKERVKKEQNSVYTSLQKCISMGILKNLPLNEDEILDLTPTSKDNPYKLLSKLKDSSKNNFSSPSKGLSSGNFKEDPLSPSLRYSQPASSEKKVILPKIKQRLSSNESVPYSEYIIGAKSDMKKEAPLLNFRSGDNSYKPQKKQFIGTNKLSYMVENLNLKQPRFTYLSLSNQKDKFKVSPRTLKADDFYYNSKKMCHLLKDSKKLAQSPIGKTTKVHKVEFKKKSAMRNSVDDLHKLEKYYANKPDGIKNQSSIQENKSFNTITPKRILKKSRLSKNGLYMTQTIDCALDLKYKQKMAKELMKTRRIKNNSKGFIL